MAATREQVSEYLKDLLSTAWQFATVSRRLTNFSNISSNTEMPALYLEEEPELHVRSKQPTPALRTLNYTAWVFIGEGLNPNSLPISLLNKIMDAIDPVTGGVLAPDDIPQNRLTLGGLVYDCYIEDQVDKVPGDVDGIGALRIPIKVIFNR